MLEDTEHNAMLSVAFFVAQGVAMLGAVMLNAVMLNIMASEN
jgi:hypothetical protein